MTDGPGPGSHRFLSTTELADLLKRLSQAFDASPGGNGETARSLRYLSSALRRSPATRLEDFLETPSPRAGQRQSARARLTVELHAMSLDEMQEMVSSGTLSRGDLVMLAIDRFAVPHSRVARMPAVELEDLVLAMVANERALDVISRAASKEGGRRTS